MRAGMRVGVFRSTLQPRHGSLFALAIGAPRFYARFYAYGFVLLKRCTSSASPYLDSQHREMPEVAAVFLPLFREQDWRSVNSRETLVRTYSGN